MTPAYIDQLASITVSSPDEALSGEFDSDDLIVHDSNSDAGN